ncbi:MAG TPA: tripartite tricarboxylate transporter substrate binding protein [Burkholderiales bacterium]|nr:tripartite tricarboxylate transporter substrate binding protein [Burkholderiales bacterium]
MRTRRAGTLRAVLCAATAAVAAASVPSLAQEYPTKPVRMIISFPPGGGSDLIARVLAQKLTLALGQTVVADNRPGASGNIAAELAARAPADGYTIFFTNSSLSISPALYRKLNFDAVADLAPISMASSYPFVLAVHPSLPVKSVKEFVALAKAKPDALAYSSAGAGTMSHFAMELMRIRTGIKVTHLPYKGAGPAAVGLMSGEAQCSFLVMPTAQAQIHAGKLRGLGVAASTRSRVLPDVPTMAEAGVSGNEAVQWNGLFAPARTPPAILDRLYRETVKAVSMPDVKERFAAEGADPVGSSPAEFSAFFKSEAQKWGEVAKRSGTKLD